MKLLEKLDDNAKDAMKHLAASFDLVERLIDILKDVDGEITANSVKEAINDSEKMSRLCSYLGREEYRVARDESKIKDALEKIIPHLEGTEQENVEKLLESLVVAAKTLLGFASRFEGKVPNEVKKLIQKEHRLLMAEKNLKLQGEIEDDQTIVNQELSDLSSNLKELSKYVSTNTTLMKQVQDLAENLEKGVAA